MFTNDAARHHHRFEATIAARDPLLNPPPFRGRTEKAIPSCLDKELGKVGLLFLPLKGGGLVGVC
jgi:hypothetical protein